MWGELKCGVKAPHYLVSDGHWRTICRSTQQVTSMRPLRLKPSKKNIDCVEVDDIMLCGKSELVILK